jgi:hypothetical protein
MALGTDCSTYASDIFNPACWIQDPLGIQPSLSVNEATCTSGTSQQQADCLNGVIAAQNQASSNPSYACAQSSFQIPCMLGLMDANGNVTNLTWVFLAIVGGIWFIGKRM